MYNSIVISLIYLIRKVLFDNLKGLGHPTLGILNPTRRVGHEITEPVISQ